MKKAFLFLLAMTFIFGILSTSINAQGTVDLDKKWSRISSDNSGALNIRSDYNYIPGPPVFQKFDLGETDVLVMPNYRILPATNTTQSELSIDIHPLNGNILFASANATNWPFSTIWGTGVYWTTNAGTNWTGFNNPPFGTNYGDPSSAIGTNGYFYEGYISGSGGMGVATSTNNGANWTTSTVSAMSSDDKNHLMVDKKVGSPYENRVYNTWTDFNGGANNNQVVLKSSTDFGATWGTLINLSSSLTPGSHGQGCNVQTGPNGEVYVVFAVYDNFPSGEDAIGFAKSTDGGATWTKARIYGAMTPNGNYNFGIRGNLKPTSIRVSSFPSMSVDRSGGANNGNIYIVWPQINVAPAGTDPDIVCLKSTDNGVTWVGPVRVNDDPLSNGKEQYYPWCTVDQTSGQLNVVWYDNRNTTSDSTGVFMARSVDGGLTFENFQVSDANFRPKPISGLASGYQGDYIGIAAHNNKAYPFWADDRTGNYQAWITEVTFGPSIDHTPLINTENLTGPYVVNAVISSVNPLIAGSIKLYWGRGVGALTDSVVMTNTGGNNYTANIPGNGLNAVYNYYLAAEDNQGFRSTLPGGAPANYFTFSAATDVIAPTITHTAIGNTAQLRWPIDVSADVTDNIGVGSVQCEFRINGGIINTFPMPLVSGSTYEGTFTGTAAIGDLVEYRIKATDNSSQSNVGYSPASGYNA
ncbi:MAG: exo-alpha-sialidase, partial [Ignavibacteriales bacterium]